MRRTAILAIAALVLSASPAQARSGPQAPFQLPEAQAALGTAQAVADVGAWAAVVNAQARDDWYAGVIAADVQGWVDGVLAARAEAARRAAARRASAPAPRATYSAPSGGGACGGATNGADRYIMRESGGSPTVQNPSGAYGCYQIMPSTWASACSDLGGEIGSSAATQAACASRLPQSAWASSGPTG